MQIIIRTTLPPQRDYLLRIMTAPNAGAHNAIYRGKALGGAVTAAQWAAIAAGTFEDLYIGDYWTKSGVNYRISAFNYYLLATNHIVIVPDTCLYNAQMHNTSSGSYETGTTANTTSGGYAGSDMYKKNLAAAKATIKNAFSGHVMKYKGYLSNGVSGGCVSSCGYYDSEVELMNENMVYGSGIFSPVSIGSKTAINYRIEKTQLPLFRHEPSRICNRETWWLRDVITEQTFARVTGDGCASYSDASRVGGVRPYFCIY